MAHNGMIYIRHAPTHAIGGPIIHNGTGTISVGGGFEFKFLTASGVTNTNGLLIDNDGTLTNGLYIDNDGTMTDGIKIDGGTRSMTLTPEADATGGGYGIKLTSSSTFQAAAAYKSLWVEHTHTPSAAGTACPIAIVGKLSLGGDNTGANNYPGMGWGVQGQVHLVDGATIDGSTFGAPGALYTGLRGVITGAGTVTFTKGALAALYAEIQLAQENANDEANFNIYGVWVRNQGVATATDMAAGIYMDSHTVTGGANILTGIQLNPVGMAKGIDISAAVSGQVIDYTTVTSVGETTEGTEGAHLIRYGKSATPIVYAPSTGGSHSAIQMYLTAANVPTGLSLAGIRTHVTYTGTTGSKATAYGGLFWVKLNCTSTGYTGDYLGGTPAGVQGVIEIPSGAVAASANDHQWLTGVAGEVRPLGTITKTGVISGLRAVINANTTNIVSGILAGVHVGAYAGTVHTGILVLPHVSSTFTTGLHIDTQYGTVTTGIATSGSNFTAGTGRGAKFAGSVATPSYGDGYGWVESELSITGTSTANIAATCSWINIGEGTHGAGGYMIAAQNNGIWEAAGATITGANIIFGMRMQHICSDTDAAGYYPFSINASGNATTALFQVSAAATNLGATIIASENGSKIGNVPLYKEDGGTVGYLRVYGVADIS